MMCQLAEALFPAMDQRGAVYHQHAVLGPQVGLPCYRSFLSASFLLLQLWQQHLALGSKLLSKLLLEGEGLHLMVAHRRLAPHRDEHLGNTEYCLSTAPTAGH